ncbi:hypothetical protein SLA2020_223450 [Shorea laevis]
MENNVNKVGDDGYSRISLFHGNVLKPHGTKLVKPQELISNNQFMHNDDDSGIGTEDSIAQQDSTASTYDERIKRNSKLPSRDILCVILILTAAIVVSINLQSWFNISSMFMMPCPERVHICDGSI